MNNETLQKIMENIDGGIAILDVKPDGSIFPGYISESFCKMVEMTLEEVVEVYGNNVFGCVHPEDRERVKKLFKKALKNKSKFSDSYRLIHKNDSYMWVHVNVNVVEDDNGNMAYYAIYTDGTKEKYDKEKFEISEQAIRVAMAQTGVSFWIYDIPGRFVLQCRNDKNIDGSIVVEKIPAVIDNFGKVHPDDLHLLMEMHEKITAGEPRATCVARWKDEKTDEFWWIEIIYTTIYDERGNPVKAVGSSTNVTKQIELENQYYEEVSNMEQMNKENVTSLRINLTKDSIDERSELNGIKLGKKSEVTFNNCFEKIVENIPNKKQRQMFAKTFSKENLMNNFSKGNEKITLEYQSRFPNGEIKWVSTTVNIYKNPITGDIELFSYTKDINAQKMAQMIIDSVVRNDYDFIADFDALNDRYIMCSIDEGAKDAPLIEGVFSKTLKKYIDNKVSEEYRELFFEQIKPKNMEKKLKKEDAFFFNYKTNDKPEPKIKMVKIFYIDKNTKHICIARTDVTKIVKEQEQRNDLLNSALQAAKQANSAKSDFLSRMSHEIRTPMNAIIGMSSIAAQAVGDDEQIADCIAKIGISSRFLLSLINDILDMSRIESGKVLLKSEKIPFEDFLHEINAICYSNAKAKGIDYENIVDNRIDEYYLGDATKLQQILINILSNAIKFTAGGGKVSLNVYQVKKDKENATIRFVINDTGCGINQKFVSKIFEPFEQEYGGTTTMYGGTGLGLAISKNLVELMDGKISVRSIVGVGSEFTVDVKLGITEDSKSGHAKKQLYDFSELKALVVDDDVTVCEHAAITLAEIGVNSEWVDSGKKAIQRVNEKWDRKEYYDLILLDWKMPDMDGIETASRIRQIVGPEVTIIIMTAYDWAVIEHEAKLAGVNLLMSKPMFKSSLISAFEKAFYDKEDEAVVATPVDFDFTGKRILLAEDHPLNVEVARKILENKGFTVEHAENGLRAMEMFTQSDVGYYDAILMDIRMPEMDGLQATHNIRRWRKADAKTIPIIAMTANAFEDDIDKSRAAGMNAHLAKPIEPRQLFQTLYNFIYDSEE